jgi:head-tail adaptor
MSQPFPTAFDQALINLVDVMKESLAASDKYGVSTPDLVLSQANVKARVCLGRGRTKEEKVEKKTAINWRTVYMRPWFDPINGKPLDNHYWLRFGTQRLDIIQVDDPSGKGHHLEVLCQLVIP